MLPNRIRRAAIFLALGVAAVLLANVYLGGTAPTRLQAAATTPPLGSAASFAVLAAAGVTNTGATALNGDLGTDPTPAITGFFGTIANDGPGVVNSPGTIHQANPTALAARNALTAAYNNAAGQAVDSTVATELGTQILAPGVYNSASGTFTITGTVTLNGSASDVWVFKTATTLVTAGNSIVSLTGGALARNVYWQVGSSATLGGSSTFRGTILANTTISAGNGASVVGRLLAGAIANTGAVTLDANSVTIPPTSPTLGKSFGPSAITAGEVSILTIVLSNPNLAPANLSAALTDTLPAGVMIAPIPNASTTCGAGVVTAVAGGATVALTGGAIPAGAPGTCTVIVNVTAPSAGAYLNTLAAGALQTSNGNNAAPVSATLSADPLPPSGGGGGGGFKPDPTRTPTPSYVFLSSAFCMVEVCPFGQQQLQVGQQMYATFSLNRVPAALVRAEAYWNGVQYTSFSWPAPYSSAGPFTSATSLGPSPDAGVVQIRVWVGTVYVGAFNATVTTPFVKGTCPSSALNCPQVVGPSSGMGLATLGTTLRWWNPPGTTQVHVRVIPVGNDGPGINMILGSPITSFIVPEPLFGVGYYILLPGMRYTWQARVTSQKAPSKETDQVWGPWSDPYTFQTRTTSSNGISLASPTNNGVVNTRTPVLRWSDSDTGVFYYEVQLSADPAFNMDPATAQAAVYWNLVHGGVSSPANSYAVPPAFALSPATSYYWRVRARIQGDGVPVSWSKVSNFRTTP